MSAASGVLGRGAGRRTLAAALIALVVLPACARRITEVDPDFTFPEGRVSDEARLIVWNEAGTEINYYLDASVPPGCPPGPTCDPACPNRRLLDPGDPQVSSETVTFGPIGAVNLMILDRTPATAFSPMRREANGGYRATLDFPLTPQRRWLDQQWELYSWQDVRPSGFVPPTYVARGMIGGVESAGSPLTNEATLADDAIQDVTYAGRCLPCDSLFTIRWQPVTGAARYWLHVFQFSSGTTERDRLQASRPAPVNAIKSQDVLIAAVPPTSTSYRIGDATRTDVIRLIERIPRYNQIHLVRISAVDSTGRLIAFSRGDFGVIDEGDRYGLYRQGAFVVTPWNRRVEQGGDPPFCQPETFAATLPVAAAGADPGR